MTSLECMTYIADHKV